MFPCLSRQPPGRYPPPPPLCSLGKKCDRVTGTGEQLAESPTVPLPVAWTEAQHPHSWHCHPPGQAAFVMKRSALCLSHLQTVPTVHKGLLGDFSCSQPAWHTGPVCRGHCLTFLGHSISSAVTSSWGVWANFQGGWLLHVVCATSFSSHYDVEAFNRQSQFN